MITKEQALNLLWERPIEIGHWVGFVDLTDMHNDWLRNFLYKEETIVWKINTTYVYPLYFIHQRITLNPFLSGYLDSNQEQLAPKASSLPID